MTFDQLKTQVKDYCGLTSTEADTRVGKSINRHYRRITSSIGMEASSFVTRSVSMTVGVQTVIFTEIEKIDRVLDTTDSTNVRLLQQVDIHTQRSTQPHESEPTTWALQNTDADSVTIRTDTVPQSAYSLQADGWTTKADLSGSNEPDFPESYHDILSWFVIAEELLKKEKMQLAAAYEDKANSLLSELRFHLADSPTLSTRQGGSDIATLTGTSGSGSGNLGATAYTQTALLTFDRGAGAAPFAVAQATAAVVTNLDADKLDGQHGTYYLARANHTGTQLFSTVVTSNTDRLLGRDTAAGGAVEEISVTGGLEFSGSQSLRIADLGVSTAKLAADAVTYAKIQNVSAASRLLGRGSAAGAGDVEELTVGANLAISGTALAVTPAGSDTHVQFNDASALAGESGLTFNKTTDVLTAAGGFNTGAGGQIVFPASQNASTNVNTIDDYEESNWTPGISFGGGTTGITYSVQSGQSVKVGKNVFFKGSITLTNKGSSTGSAKITGLPFAEGDNVECAVTFGGYSGFTGLGETLVGVVDNSGTSISIHESTATGTQAVTDAAFQNNSALKVSGWYRATA